MIPTGDWRDAIAKSVRYLAEIAGDDPDAAEAAYRESAAIRDAMPRPPERDTTWAEHWAEQRADDRADRHAVDYDAEMDRYERSRGL